MATKISNFSDLIQRVTASCLLTPLTLGYEPTDCSKSPAKHDTREVVQEEEEEEEKEEGEGEGEGEGEEKESSEGDEESEEEVKKEKKGASKRVTEMESLMGEMFEVVSELKKAYVSLQEAHCPWDPVKMSVADVAVVTELKKLGRMRERYRRMRRGGRLGFAPLREAVVPYEAAVEELKKEVKEKEAEVENLKEKLRCVSVSGKKGKFQSKRKVSCGQLHVAAAPVPEMFEATMAQIKENSKSFTSLLLSLMRSARWDISAAVRSIESANTTPTDPTSTNSTTASLHHAKYTLESYVCLKIFKGFDHETFYIDGSLTSLLNPDQFRRDCFTQFQDMKSMDPTELLGILPTCHFGKFCSKKYLSIIHPKMEESLFGNLEQNRLVSAGSHPRSEFYCEFLKLAKAVWLLHLLAFAFNPSPSLFMGIKGVEFQPEYMESVVRTNNGRMPVGQIVGFPVCPGFKLGNGSVVKARVYLATRK